jgi:NtrC-family two-component system sensor histidine kinase KinB
MQCATTDAEKRIEAPMLLPSGEVKTFEITFSKQHDSPGVTGVARDITQQKAVAELKERLLAIVSHDLRTPLASLSITLSVIVEGKRVSDPELRKQLASIDVSIQDVMALTHDLLSLEKQESELSDISFQPVKAYNVWLQTKAVMQPLCKERNVALSGPSSDAELLANEEKLVQAANIIAKTVLNLSATDAQMNVSIEKGADYGLIRISTDNLLSVAGGAKVMVERLRNVDEENIFDSENITLSIARAIIEKHKGQLLFESTEAGGFEISINVPSTVGIG